MTQLGQILLGGLGLYIHSKTLVERAVQQGLSGGGKPRLQKATIDPHLRVA
jgi:hypothetical protein